MCDQAAYSMTSMLSTSYFVFTAAATTLLKSMQGLSISLVTFSSVSLPCEFHALGHLWFVSASKNKHFMFN